MWERDAVRFARMLTDSLRTIFRYVEPRRAHDQVYSHELRSLRILACTEVENACKAILTQNGVKPVHRPPSGRPRPRKGKHRKPTTRQATSWSHGPSHRLPTASMIWRSRSLLTSFKVRPSATFIR
jgi:hypothetical protein